MPIQKAELNVNSLNYLCEFDREEKVVKGLRTERSIIERSQGRITLIKSDQGSILTGVPTGIA